MSVHESDISESEDDDDEDVKDEVTEETVSEEEEGPSVSSSNNKKAANNALAKERDEASSIRSITSTGSNDTAYAEFLRFLLSPTLTISLKDDASGSVVVVKDDASSKSLVLSVKSDAGYMEFLLFLKSPSLIEKGDGAEKVLDDKPLEVRDMKEVAVSEVAAIGDVALRTSSVEKGEVRDEEGASVRFTTHLNEAMIVVASMDLSFEKMEVEEATSEDLNEAGTENVELDDVNAYADKEMEDAYTTPHSQEMPLGADTDEVVRKASDASKAMEESAAKEPVQEAGSSEQSPPSPRRILMAAAAVRGAIARSRSPDETTEVTATDNAFTKSSTVVELKTANSEAPLSSAETVLVAATINGVVASWQSTAKPAKEAATDGICMRSSTVAETVETAYSKELSLSLRKVCVAGNSGILDKQIQIDGAATERSYTVSTPLEIADNGERSPSPEKILVAAAIGPGKQTEEVVEIDDVSAKSLTVVEPIKGTVHSGEQSPMLEKVLATAVISQTVGRSCSPEESMEEDIKFDDVSAKLSTQFEPLEETADSEERSPSPEKVFVAAAIVWAVVRSHIAWAITRSRSPDNEDVSVKSSATLESTLDSTGEIIVRSSTSLSLDESKAGNSCSGEVLVTEKVNITDVVILRREGMWVELCWETISRLGNYFELPFTAMAQMCLPKVCFQLLMPWATGWFQ